MVLPVKSVMTSTRVAADTFEVLIGPGAAGAISALVMFSSFGALNGIVMVGPRVYYQMAQDGLWFKFAGHLHPRFQTPDRAIIVQAIWSSVLVMTGSYRALFTRVIYTEWIFFALLALGVVIMRRRPRLRAGVADGARPDSADPVHHRVADDCREPDQGRRGERGDGPWNCRDGIPGILFLGPPMKIDFHNHYYPPEYLAAVKQGPHESSHGLRRGRQSAAALSRRLQHPRARSSRSRLSRRCAEETRRRQAGDHVHDARDAFRRAGDRREQWRNTSTMRSPQRSSSAVTFCRWRRCR